ncbi:MAG: tetratricopeptide repeat protein [Pontibacterium sp.]
MEINYSGKSVLIVDNTLEDLASLRQILGHLGVQRIQVAASVNMALSLLRIEKYDLCFVDYDLGKDDKNGLQLLHEANAESLLTHRHLFILVVDTERSNLLFGSLEHSPDTYISKPYQLPKVRARLDKVMRIKHVTEPVDQLLDEGELAAALQRCDQLADLFPGLQLYLCRLKGIILLQLKRYSAALKLFELLTERRDLPWAEVGLGSACFHLGRYDDALKILNRVVDNQHVCVEAFSWLGRAHRAKGSLQQAVTLMRKAIMLQPTVPQLQRELADLAAQASDWELSVDAYRAAVRYARYSVFQEPSSYFGLARALAYRMKEAGEAQAAEAEEEVIRLFEAVVLDHQHYEGIGLRAKLCAGDIFRIGNVPVLAEQRLHDAWAMFQALSPEVQCLWLDAVLDATAGTPLADEVNQQKKALSEVMVGLPWAKANLKALMSFRKGDYEAAFLLFRHAHQAQPGHIGIALNLIQAGIEVARRETDSAVTLIRCNKVLSQVRFGELSERQQGRYRALAKHCAELIRPAPAA